MKREAEIVFVHALLIFLYSRLVRNCHSPIDICHWSHLENKQFVIGGMVRLII